MLPVTKYVTALSISITALLLHLPTLVSAATAAPEFATCATSSYVPNAVNQNTKTNDGASCANYCYNKNPAYKYSVWASTSKNCGCGTNTFSSAATVAGNPGGCGANFEVYITRTTFAFQYCVQTYQVDQTKPLIQSSTTDYASIFTTCATYGNIAIYPSGNTFLYSCGFGYTPIDNPATCDRFINRIYFHPADATASGLSRRSRGEKRRLSGGQEPAHAESFWCPKGMNACQVEHDPASYELLND